MWARSLHQGHPPVQGGEGDATPEPVLRQLSEASTRWIELDPYSQNAHIMLAQTENRMGNVERAQELITAIEGFDVVMDDLQLTRLPDGGGTLMGSIRNSGGEVGSSVTVGVTFYGASDATIGTGSVTVQLPAQDATQVFEIPLESDQQILGYTYTLEGM